MSSLRPTSKTTGLHVLLIDDEPLVQRVLSKLMTGAGHIVTCAASCSEGQTVLETSGIHFDLVVTDVFMEGGDGLEVLQMLRESWPSLKVIVMSGRFGVDSFGTGLMKVATRLGAHAVLPKPVEAMTLLETIDAIFLTPEGGVSIVGASLSPAAGG